jgi:hypothetical protein
MHPPRENQARDNQAAGKPTTGPQDWKFLTPRSLWPPGRPLRKEGRPMDTLAVLFIGNVAVHISFDVSGMPPRVRCVFSGGSNEPPPDAGVTAAAW